MNPVYCGFLTQRGFYVPTSTLRARFGKELSKLWAKLRHIYRPKIGPPVLTKLYSEEIIDKQKCTFLPRSVINTFIKSGILNSVQNLLPPVRTITINRQTCAHNNQLVLKDYLMDHVFTPARRIAGTATAILNLRAGMGKTFVAGSLIAELQLRTLYIVPKRPLAVQGVKDLRACLTAVEDGSVPVVNMFVGKSASAKERRIDQSEDDVTVIVINSALKQSPEFFAGYSFIILDEVHSYCSSERRAIFSLTTSHCVLGMSATTEDREDGADIIAHKALVTDKIIRAENVAGFSYENIKFDCRAKVIQYVGPEEYTHNLTHESTDLIFTHYMHNQFIDDPYRLSIAVDELVALYDWCGINEAGEETKHHIYVFAEELGILLKGKAAFEAALRSRARADIADDCGVDLPADGLEMFVGGLKDQDIGNIALTGRVLFSTYGYAGTGISITKMTAMMFLTPRKANMKQIMARIIRRGSDLSIPRVIIDIVDFLTALKHQLNRRMDAYEFYEFAIETVRVYWNKIEVRNNQNTNSELGGFI